MTENMKNLDEEIAQQIKNDHIKKMVFTARNYSLEDVETIVCGNLNTIAYEYEKALSALRASWEKEKARLQDHIDLMVDEFMRIKAISNSEIQGLCERAITTTKQHIPVIEQRDILQNGLDSMRAENQALEAEKKGLKDELEKMDKLEGVYWLRKLSEKLKEEKSALEKEKAGLEERVKDLLKGENESMEELTRLKSRNEELEAEKSKLEERVIFLERGLSGAEYLWQEKVDRLSASLAAAQESLRKIYEMPFSSGCGDEQRIAQEALSDPTGHLAFEKWKALQNTKQEYDKAMNVCLDKFSNQKFGSVADCLNGIFEKWKKMEAVVEAAREVTTYVQCMEYNSSERLAVDELRQALKALDAKGGVSE